MNMKSKITSAALALAVGAFSASSFAAEATASAGGTVITPIAITKAADLSFGKFAPGAGGTVTISTSGARTGSGVILSSVGSSPTAARFNVTGDADATYSISINAPTTLSDGAATASTMGFATFSDLTGGGATSGNVTSGTLTGGAQSIFVGGTLTVGASQKAASYAGNVTVTVEYN
jgi:spore coat protein U-like protein